MYSFEEVCQEKDLEKVRNWVDRHGEQEAGKLLLHAAANGAVEVVEVVLEKNIVNKHISTEFGDTALHLAAREGQQAVVQLLVKAGASLTVRNNDGQTAMEMMGNIPSNVLEKILDNCLECERKGNKLVLNIRYPFLSSNQIKTGSKVSDLTSVCPQKNMVRYN